MNYQEILFTDQFSMIRDKLVNDLSNKTLNQEYVFSKMEKTMEEFLPKGFVDFFLKPIMSVDVFKAQIVALMDLLLKMKHYQSELSFNIKKGSTMVSYQHVSSMLTRYDVKHEIKDNTIVLDEKDDSKNIYLVERGEISKKLNELIPEKIVKVSSSVRIEEKRQVYLVKEKDVYNPFLEKGAQLQPFKDVDDLKDIKIPFNQDIDKLDFMFPVTSDVITDANYLVQHVLPKTRNPNPDYLYAVGHDHAHFYPRRDYLHDRFMQIVEANVKDKDKNDVVIITYSDYAYQKLFNSGYKVLRGYDSMLDPDLMVFIHPDINDSPVEEIYSETGLPGFMNILNKHMGEVKKFQLLCRYVAYPYYPYMKGGRFDKDNLVPITFHRPYCMVIPELGIGPKYHQHYFDVTLKLSFYRTYLMYTGENYNMGDLYDVDLTVFAPYFKKINELVIKGNGYVGHIMTRENLVLTAKVDKDEELLFGTVDDYVKVVSPIINKSMRIVSSKGRRVLKKFSKKPIVLRTNMKPALIDFHRYLRGLRHNQWDSCYERIDMSFGRMIRVTQ
jgi:hypothetical protein